MSAMINELLCELELLSLYQESPLGKHPVPAPPLRDAMLLEDAIRESKEVNRLALDDGLPDRRARASSITLPPSLQLRICTSRSCDSLVAGPAWMMDPDEGPPESAVIGPRSSSLSRPPPRPRALTAPDLQKPLPPSPKTPTWPISPPISFFRKKTPKTNGRHPLYVSSDDDTALLFDNIALEPEDESQLPFVPGQSYRRLPRRGINDASPMALVTSDRKSSQEHLVDPSTFPASQDPSPVSMNATAPLEKVLPSPPPIPSTSTRLRKTLEKKRSFFLSRSSAHARSRTLSPERSPPPLPMLAKRAQSARESRKKGVRFIESES